MERDDNTGSITPDNLPETTPSPPNLLPVITVDEHSGLTSLDKINLIIRFFVARNDVYAKRWENPYTGEKGYSPDCLHEWEVGVCDKLNKPRKVKCSECKFSEFMPLRNRIIALHLQGRLTAGTYALLKDETCKFVVGDFDKKTWKKDVVAFAKTCRSYSIPVYIEISRSGNGAHAWILFETPVPATAARKLGTALISKTCLHIRQLSLDSYDRLFPAQDRMPKGGFGNQIVLPMQGGARKRGCGVFVTDDLGPIEDPWMHIQGIKTVSMFELESLIQDLVGSEDALDVAFFDRGSKQKLLKSPCPKKVVGLLPETLEIAIDKGIRISRANLHPELQHHLIRLACFENKQYHINMKMGFSVRMQRRVLSEYKLLSKELVLPRGSLESVLNLLKLNGVKPVIDDKRSAGQPIYVKFTGELWDDQQAAFDEVVKYNDGVLCAPPAFGKTVIGAALIAERAVSTLIIVNTTLLHDQWRDRLPKFLSLEPEEIGSLVGGKAHLTGVVDVACIGSMPGQDNLEELLQQYGQIIVDECHHMASNQYKRGLGTATPLYIFGITAEDERSDGHQPLVFMRCGPIRYMAEKSTKAPEDLQAIIRFRTKVIDLPAKVEPSDLYANLAADEARTEWIVEDILENYHKGRICLVLTQRVNHVKAFVRLLTGKVNLFVMDNEAKGVNSKPNVIKQLAQIPPGTPHVLVATYSLAGEAFDHKPLDTLFLGLPFSWKGRLRQYAGRLDRGYELKTYARVYDYVDQGHPATVKMWTHRRPRYKKLGYRFVGASPTPDFFDPE
jgi:superfamily II DNA or RNA helicase